MKVGSREWGEERKGSRGLSEKRWTFKYGWEMLMANVFKHPSVVECCSGFFLKNHSRVNFN